MRAGDTHCRKGHVLAEVGTYLRKDLDSLGRPKERVCCAECKRITQKTQTNRRSRERRARDPDYVPSRRGPQTQGPDEQARATKVLLLMDDHWRASTVWEREDIQNEIDSLKAKSCS